LVAITKELLGLSKYEQRSENIFKYLYFIGRDIHIMWIRGVYKPLMQACVESGHFCTVGILILGKIFLENQLLCSKKNHALNPFISNSNRTRVFTISSLKRPDFTGIFLLIVPQMPDGKGLQFFCFSKKK
jgi:hypothetical protein